MALANAPCKGSADVMASHAEFGQPGEIVSMATQPVRAPWSHASKPLSPVWLRVPYLVDIALVVIGVVLLLTGRGVGWWVLIVAGLRVSTRTATLF